MIYLDDCALPVDKTGDGGDSSMRAGMITMTREKSSLPLNKMIFGLSNYEIGDTGLLIRHPHDFPWNSYKNFTRDQMLPLLAGMKSQGLNEMAARVFKARKKAWFFAQNTERDYPGTTKFPWPHTFINDKGVEEKRSFDFADPLMPNHIGAMILVGKVKWAYWFLPFAYLFHFLHLYVHSCTQGTEENQTIAECYIFGTLKTYKKLKKDWKNSSYVYWSKRNEVEYHEALSKLIDNL